MSRIRIRLVDKTHADPIKNAKHCKRWDVISVLEDGQDWSATEKASLEHAIINLPQVSSDWVRLNLMQREPGDWALIPQLQVRYRYIDGDVKLPGAVRDAIESTREYTFNVTDAQLNNYISTRPPLPDPEQI